VLSECDGMSRVGMLAIGKTDGPVDVLVVLSVESYFYPHPNLNKVVCGKEMKLSSVWMSLLWLSFLKAKRKISLKITTHKTCRKQTLNMQIVRRTI